VVGGKPVSCGLRPSGECVGPFDVELGPTWHSTLCDEAAGYCVAPEAHCADGWCHIPPRSYLSGYGSDRFEGSALDAAISVVQRGFYVQETEFTRGDFVALMGYEPQATSACGSDCPVTGVTLFEAVAVANTMSTVLVYAAAAHAQGGVFTGAMSWASITAIAHQLDPAIVRIGFIFVMVGYGTKAGLAPMHMWLPDAHSQAPTPVSALLSGVLIKCAIFGIIRFHIIARAACGPEFSGELLMVFGLVSVVVATPFILAQHDLKRLLGYHSVEHIGIVALGLGFGGRLGTYGALLHVITHGVTKALVFLGAGDVIARYRNRDMRAIRGYLGVAPVAATLLLFGTLSLAGLPPFSIFMSELLVVQAGIGAGHLVAVGVFLVMLLIIFAGIIHHVGEMVFGVAGPEVSRERERVTPLVGMVLLAAVMLALGLTIPAPLNQLLEQAVEVILG